MTNMAAMPIYGKNPSKILFSGIGGLISIKISMKYRELQPFLACSYDDTVLTLTYVTAISKLVTKACL